MTASTLNLALAAALVLLAPRPALANPLETIDVLCGGRGPEERERLRGEVVGATVSLEFTVAELGPHVADVDVLFTPIAAPVDRPFGIVASGPVCYLQLPPGEYRIDTWFNGHARSTRTRIPAQSPEPIRVAVEFPEEPGKDAFLVPATVQDPQAKTP
jgi:hypothetical protein